MDKTGSSPQLAFVFFQRESSNDQLLRFLFFTLRMRKFKNRPRKQLEE